MKPYQIICKLSLNKCVFVTAFWMRCMFNWKFILVTNSPTIINTIACSVLSRGIEMHEKHSVRYLSANFFQ